MKKKFLIFIVVISVWACKQQYIPETCGNIQDIYKTETLTTGDTLIPFAPIGSNNTPFSSLNNTTFLLFKKNSKPFTGGYNEEIAEAGSIFLNREIIALAKQKGIDIVVETDLKIAKIYGLEILAEGRLRKSGLFVADSNRIVSAIYKNICEEDIARMVAEWK
ncbi:MAG: hypothetical protein OIF50_01520 [Flavobacteriaceae bacterium]|nr:hypothetical protein [Flavobacteriaceae bacterium]